MVEPLRRTELSDAHVHLQDDRFGSDWADIEKYLTRAREAGVVRFLCAGTSPADWNRVAEIARRFDGVLAAFGIHPWKARKVSGDWIPVLAKFLTSFVSKDGATRASLGEVGLDFAVRDLDETERREQERVFRAQLSLANSLGVPATIHSVRANELVLKILREYPKIPALLLHGWIATPNEIASAVETGAFFSFSARSVDPSATRGRATVAAVPRDRILLESDGPRLLPPNGYAGAPIASPRVYLERKSADGFLLEEPAAILSTGREIAAIRKTPVEEFFAQLALNERRFFQAIPVKSKN